ncbi:MAG: hypothetical protein SH820_04780 [Xanthomonadales bacterium]|nr:hypothetical protein [Xanthomonadales bacterium]
MQSLTQQVLRAGLADRVFTEQQLARLLDGTDQRRYNLVNRAAKAGELIYLRRGLYVLSDRYRSMPGHPFALAQMFEPGSYVSLESALAYHAWIPEAVYTTTSILPGRKSKEFSHEKFGLFTFHPLSIHTGYFLEGVQRTQSEQQTFFLADPLRAFMDLVCLKKIEWQGMRWIEQGMRIDPEVWNSITDDQMTALNSVYKNKRVRQFLSELQLGLENEASFSRPSQ